MFTKSTENYASSAWATAPEFMQSKSPKIDKALIHTTADAARMLMMCTVQPLKAWNVISKNILT